MKKVLRCILSSIPGVLYAAAVVLLSRLLLFMLADLAGLFGPIAGLDADTLAYVRQILVQLKTADVVSPWLPALLTGAAAGILTIRLTGRRTGRIIAAAVWFVLLLPLTLVALWFTSVNSIMTGALIRTLLPLIPALL